METTTQLHVSVREGPLVAALRTEVMEEDNYGNHHYGSFIWLRTTGDAEQTVGPSSSQRVQLETALARDAAVRSR